MLIQSGKVALLEGLPWAAIDFYESQKAIETRVEEIVLHLVRWSRIHMDGPFQMLFPVKKRTLDGVELFSPYLWVRALDLKSLVYMGTVPGVEGLVGGRNPIAVEDSFVQGLIRQGKEFSGQWSAGLEVGSFVRVLMGSNRMLCGKVLSRTETDAKVLIALRTKTIELKIPVLALQKLEGEGDYFYRGN
jgi:hypothetical protein